jgi:hypothetical protein
MSEHIKYFYNLEQGTHEWLEARLGIVTASEMGRLVTPKLSMAKNDKSRGYMFSKLSERMTGEIEETPQTWDMERGHIDEKEAIRIYSETRAPVAECGFITNNKLGPTMGYSPDGLVGNDGLVECKSRLPKYQIKTIYQHVVKSEYGAIPDEYMMQLQAGLYVSERQWIDFISYCDGLDMVVIRVYPMPNFFEAIEEVFIQFEISIEDMRRDIEVARNTSPLLIPTETEVYEEVAL